MRFFRNLSIGIKFTSVVLLIIFLELIISIVAIYFLNKTNENLNTIVDVQAENVKLGAQINRNLIEINTMEQNIILSHNKQNIERYASNLEENKHQIEQGISRMRLLVQGESLVLLDQFQLAYQDYIQVDNEIQELINTAWDTVATEDEEPDEALIATYREKAQLLLSQSGAEAFDQASSTIQSLVQITDQDLVQRKAQSNHDAKTARTIMILISSISIVGGLFLGLLISRSIASGLSEMMYVTDAIADGELETPIRIRSEDEVGHLSGAINNMQTSLREANKATREQDWLKTGISRLNDAMRGKLNVTSLSQQAINEISSYLGVQVGALYLFEEKNQILTLQSGYAFKETGSHPTTFRLGEGLVGQAAEEKRVIIIQDVPEDYIKVTSGLGEAGPQVIVISPLLFGSSLKGVIEIASTGSISDLHLAYLEQAAPILAINLETTQGQEALAMSLAMSQAFSEKLQVQQEELQSANEELEEQARLLEESQAKLELQQEELQTTNQELEEKNESLQRQKREIEQARKEIETKAEQVANASRYKSEFLANMSHELRTPLNSVLLLARILADNKNNNLTSDQVESANIIYSSGSDLLALINEILDLSKIEAGKMDIRLEKILLRDIAENIRSNFQHMAAAKNLSLDISVEENAPVSINNDRQRVDQILKNFLSNAIKFTNRGSVKVIFKRPDSDTGLSQIGLKADQAIAIQVKDTGIGIPIEKQKIIFEAFQQLDGGTARAFGGTGLGLTISRELANLLGGEIQVQSVEGEGSTFTLLLPISAPGEGPIHRGSSAVIGESHTRARTVQSLKETDKTVIIQSVPDDRMNLQPNDQTILVIEDDPVFAKLLLQQCHQKGFKCLISPSGEEGIDLVSNYNPKAIILDIKLPGINGWTVLENLKDNPQTRHIPVHVMSIEDATLDALRKGAIGFLTKPVTREGLDEAFIKLEATFSRKIKELLIVEDDKNQRKAIIQLFDDSDIHVDEASTGKNAIEAILTKKYDCVILDLGLPDMTGFQVLRELESQENLLIPPIIVYTGKELSREEESELSRYSDSIIIKGVKSEERLLDEVSLFLHRVVGNIPEKKRRMIASLHDSESLFQDKRILVVDDDMRNVFALSRIMEEKGMQVFKAENGEKALTILNEDSEIDLVIMDIMMPVMDGYETIRQIRAQEQFQKLPVIALTAKAMRQDRDLCIAAGASDYLPKPVDTSRLFSMMRVWLYQ